MASERPLALALSGGGVRAMVFHFGVLRCLAENGGLERVTHISSVSGGSLAIGLLLQESQLRWPTSEHYTNHSLPRLRQKLCSRSLMMGMLRQLRKPSNWCFLLSRANLLAGALRHEWGIRDRLSTIPSTPEWSINGTTAETGKRFRFKKESLGDYVIGYADSETFPLANAMAVSAAFPGGIGPLAINSREYIWKQTEWNAPIESAKPVDIEYSQLHLYDGGIYDNLGLEPFFDAGKGNIKNDLPENLQIVVSDAGAPLKRGFSYSHLNPWRMKRVVDIMSDQSRSLRVRTFENYVYSQADRGAYIHIGDCPSNDESCSSDSFAAAFPTTLRKLKPEEFDRLLEHGYQLAAKFKFKYG